MEVKNDGLFVWCNLTSLEIRSKIVHPSQSTALAVPFKPYMYIYIYISFNICISDINIYTIEGCQTYLLTWKPSSIYLRHEVGRTRSATYLHRQSKDLSSTLLPPYSSPTTQNVLTCSPNKTTLSLSLSVCPSLYMYVYIYITQI